MSASPITDRLDAGKSPEQLLAERTKRVNDALELRQPDRIPMSMAFGYYLAEWGGVTHQELQDDPETAQRLLEAGVDEWQPEIFLALYNQPGPSVVLGDRMTKWPGHQLPADGSFQFDEHEFMKAEDYDEFLRDPSDWAVRKYLPRAFSELEGLGEMPPLGMFAFGHYNLSNLPLYATPGVVAALKKLAEAAEVAARNTGLAGASAQRMAQLGYPPHFLAGALIEAPFDFMSDTLRGMRGIMKDVIQRPDKLMAAQRTVLETQLQYAEQFCNATGLRSAFIPLHRGSDGFMSVKQFAQIYWPPLKEMMERLVEMGIRPTPFYEGIWDERLEYLAELPKGKTIGMFQNSNMAKVKEVVGDTLCIIGGMPNSLLVGGTVEQVREKTQELCEVVGKGGGFIMSTEVAEMEGMKPELVTAWVEATREYGVY